LFVVIPFFAYCTGLFAGDLLQFQNITELALQANLSRTTNLRC
jgi:hypothetical protein